MPPRLLIEYVLRLPDTSLTAAYASGGREHFGWGMDRHMSADLYDALNFNTRVSRDWKKPPEIPEYPRPKNPDAETAKKPKSVRDLWAQMSTKRRG